MPRGLRWSMTENADDATRQPIPAALYRPLGLRENPFPTTLPSGEGAMPGITDAARELAEWASSAPSGERAGEHLSIITGAARSGRTTLLQAAMHRLAAETSVRVVSITPGEPRLTTGRLLRAIVTGTGETPLGRSSLDMIRQIRRTAEASQPLVLAIDAVPQLDGSHLDVLRALLLEGTTLRIVLTGTPDLVDRIQRRQSLAERLAHHHAIAPLSADALATDLHRRLDAVASAEELRPAVRFAPEAVAIIAAWSEGIIGPAVELAGECLLETIARGKRAVDDEIAHDVTREFIDRARLAARAHHLAASPFAIPATQAMLNLATADATTVRHDLTANGGRP